MITVKEYRGHIRNWEELCERLEIPLDLTREEREERILIRAYETWGYEMADHMHGMFAFALWDDEEKKLFCLRDQFGTKPFYYYETADGNLLYGTTIRRIMEQPGFVKELNEEMLQLYLSLTYVAGENTFFRGLKKLMPGFRTKETGLWPMPGRTPWQKPSGRSSRRRSRSSFPWRKSRWKCWQLSRNQRKR